MFGWVLDVVFDVVAFVAHAGDRARRRRYQELAHTLALREANDALASRRCGRNGCPDSRVSGSRGVGVARVGRD